MEQKFVLLLLLLNLLTYRLTLPRCPPAIPLRSFLHRMILAALLSFTPHQLRMPELGSRQQSPISSLNQGILTVLRFKRNPVLLRLPLSLPLSRRRPTSPLPFLRPNSSRKRTRACLMSPHPTRIWHHKIFLRHLSIWSLPAVTTCSWSLGHN